MSSTRDASQRVWLITGASSGFGRAIATAALEGGDVVVATARRPQALDDLVTAAILTALAAEHTPLRLALGGDAVDGIRAHLTSVGEEITTWESLSRSTSFDPV